MYHFFLILFIFALQRLVAFFARRGTAPLTKINAYFIVQQFRRCIEYRND
jgi:hypothetical protein